MRLIEFSITIVFVSIMVLSIYEMASITINNLIYEEDRAVYKAITTKVAEVVMESDYPSLIFQYDPYIGGTVNDTTKSAILNITKAVSEMTNRTGTQLFVLMSLSNDGENQTALIYDSTNPQFLSDPRIIIVNGSAWNYVEANLPRNSFVIKYPFVVSKTNESFRLTNNQYVISSGFIDYLISYKSVLRAANGGSPPPYDPTYARQQAMAIAEYLMQKYHFYGYEGAVLVQHPLNATAYVIGFNSMDITDTENKATTTTLDTFVSSHYGDWTNVVRYDYSYDALDGRTYNVVFLYYGDHLWLDSDFRLIWLYVVVGVGE